MKSFAIASAFALVCGMSSAASSAAISQVSSSDPIGTIISGISYDFDQNNTKLEIKFGDLKKYYESDGSDPLDTFIFFLGSNITNRANQNLTLDFAPMRNAVPNLPLSFSGCDGMGINCYPENKNPGVARPFAGINLTDNTATLNTQFALQGQLFYVYLQIQKTLGKDNEARPAMDPKNRVEAPHSDLYNQVVNFNKPQDIALTITINGSI